MGFYYSQAQDWINRGGAKARLNENEGWDDAHKGDFDIYLKNLAVPQVRTVRTRTDGPSLNGALAGTGQLQLAFCVLLSAGLLAS